MNIDNHITNQGFKASTAAAGAVAGITWNEVAAILAAIYSAILIGEWIYKRFIKKRPVGFPDTEAVE